MTTLALQAAAISRSCVNLRGMLEVRTAIRERDQYRWPAEDLEMKRQLLVALEAADETFRRLVAAQNDPAMRPLVALLMRGR